MDYRRLFVEAFEQPNLLLRKTEVLRELAISAGGSASQRNNMKLYCKNKAALVRYAKEQLNNLPDASQLTMTITPLKSGGFSAQTVTSTWSADTAPEKS